MAEDHEPPCLSGGRAEQPFVVRIAAHHTVEDDDVGRLDLFGSLRDVDESTIDAPCQAGGVQQLRGLWLVLRGDLQVRRRRGTMTQQLDMELTQATTDLQDAGVVDPAILEEPDN